MLLTPIELREQSRRYGEVARESDFVASKRQLAAEALALRQLAENVERGARVVDLLQGAEAESEKLLAQTLDDKRDVWCKRC